MTETRGRPARAPLQREAIVAAARTLVAKDGLAALSLRRVAALLGVTAPALYAHVRGKRDLVRAVAEFEYERLGERVQQIEVADPIERIRAGGRLYLDHARENPHLFRLLFEFRPELTPRPRGDELNAATHAFEAGASAVRAAIEAGQLRREDPLVTSLAIWTAVHGLASVILAGAELGREQENRVYQTLMDALLAGLAPVRDT
jgi:AcrR family transcriptional regulator